MEKVLGVVLLLDSLSDNEHKELLTQMVETMSRRCLQNMIFQYMIMIFQNNNIAIKEIRKQINIIHERNQTKQYHISTKSSVSTEHRLDRMPMTVINEMGSFLSLNDFLKFQMANRTMYIALNSPSKLHHIWVRKPMLKDSIKQLTRFRFAKSLGFPLFDLYTDMATRSYNSDCDSTIWNQVESLEFLICDHGLSVPSSSDQIDAFISSNLCNLNKIRSVSLQCGLEELPIELSKIKEIIDKTPNLKSFTLDLNHDNAFSSPLNCLLDLKEPIKVHLEHLSIFEDLDFDEQHSDIIHYFKTEQLLSFGCAGGAISTMLEDQKFVKLEELEIRYAKYQDIVELNKKQIKYLRKLDISIEMNPNRRIFTAIGRFFRRQSMEYIRFHDANPDVLCGIIEEIQEAMLNCGNKRKCIGIELSSLPVNDSVLSTLLCLISSLCALFKSHFILKLMFYWDDIEELSELNKWLDGIRKEYLLDVYNPNNDEEYVVIKYNSSV